MRTGKKGTTEDEAVGWHRGLNGHEFEQALGVGGQGSLACCRPWYHEESDTTERLNNNNETSHKMMFQSSSLFKTNLENLFNCIA